MHLDIQDAVSSGLSSQEHLTTVREAWQQGAVLDSAEWL
jgi:hypothetical protein